MQGHAKQFKRLRKVVNRQRTILGVVMHEVQRKLDAHTKNRALALDDCAQALELFCVALQAALGQRPNPS